MVADLCLLCLGEYYNFTFDHDRRVFRHHKHKGMCCICCGDDTEIPYDDIYSFERTYVMADLPDAKRGLIRVKTKDGAKYNLYKMIDRLAGDETQEKMRELSEFKGIPLNLRCQREIFST
eukprot:gb/GECH01010785.1/.p1 GENE.gb/GECH01010785.1/~~gb/GECH01010785.1/.p1  ORF type:complete len:120 (+),score=17.01 gb/GECH01010785.1/:1-360(+)